MSERFAAEKRQNHLEEFLTTKIGQLSDGTRESLEQYITDNFSEEEADKLLEHAKWNNDLMSGLAAMQQDIKEFAGDDKSAGFIAFLNNQLKPEVDKFADRLGISFEGWQVPEELSAGTLEVNLRFVGQKEAVKAVIIEPEKTSVENEGQEQETAQADLGQMPLIPSPQTVEAAQDEAQTVSQYMLLQGKGTGYLINLVA
jgi:hypothetical protein